MQCNAYGYRVLDCEHYDITTQALRRFSVAWCVLQMRNLQRRVSRDADIVVAAMISIVGSTLIFQGWRLDPLLLLCQVSNMVFCNMYLYDVGAVYIIMAKLQVSHN